jgi:hypothetical protein
MTIPKYPNDKFKAIRARRGKGAGKGTKAIIAAKRLLQTNPIINPKLTIRKVLRRTLPEANSIKRIAIAPEEKAKRPSLPISKYPVPAEINKKRILIIQIISFSPPIITDFTKDINYNGYYASLLLSA